MNINISGVSLYISANQRESRRHRRCKTPKFRRNKSQSRIWQENGSGQSEKTEGSCQIGRTKN